MKKRGFTLVELLGVIVVLASIALIATPIVMNIIENSKKGAAERSMSNIEHAAELYFYNKKLNDVFTGTIFNCENGVCSNGETNLNIEGKIPESGKIKIDKDGIITLNSLVVDGYVCYKEENYTCGKANKESNSVTNGVITLEDSKPTILSNYIIKGNSYQETRSGINLLNNHNIKESSSTPGSLTGAIITDEYIDIVRQKNFDYANIPISLEAGKTYTLWYEYEIYDRPSDGTGYSTIGMGFSAEGIKTAAYSQNQIDQRIYTYTPTEDIDLYARLYANYGSDTPGKVRFRVMLLEGEYTLDTIPEYEPYGATPSPEFPSEIQSVGDLVIDEKDPNYGKYEIPIRVTGKNLLNLNHLSDFSNWDNTGTYAYYDLKLPAGTYTYKMNTDLTTYTSILLLNKTAGSSIVPLSSLIDGSYNIKDKEKFKSFTIEEGEKIYINWYKGASSGGKTQETLTELVNDLLQEFMIVKGEYTRDTMPEYEPYKENKNSIYLDEPLRCIGNTCDYIDYENNQLVRNVGVFNFSKLYKEISTSYYPRKESNLYRVIIDDSESIFNEYGDGKANFPTTRDKNLLGHSNYFKTFNWNNLYFGFGQYTTNGTIYLYLDTKHLGITLDDSESTAYTKLSNWINSLSKDVVVTYTLKEPNITKIFLPDIKLNKGKSNIIIDTTIKPSEFIIDYYN